METTSLKRDIYFKLYDQLQEPERSQAKNNWNARFIMANGFRIPDNAPHAVKYGFLWTESQEGFNYWAELEDKFYDGYEFIKPLIHQNQTIQPIQTHQTKDEFRNELMKELIEQIRKESIPEDYNPNSLSQAMTLSNYFKGVNKAIEIIESKLK